MNILPIIFENTDYDTTITIQVKGSGAAVPLPGTIELTMYKHGETAPFVTATVANSKLTSVGALTGVIVTNIAAADLADTGSQFGSIYVRRTDVPTVIVAFPVRFVEAGETLPADYDGTVLVQTSEITVEVRATVSPDVPPGSVTNTYLADMAAGTVKGNITGSTDGPADVTLADLRTAMGLGADAAKGAAALELVPAHLRGEKFIIVDLIGDGVAERDGATMTFSTVAARSTVTRAGANARRRTRKRGGEAVAANTLRAHHSKEGSPLGVLYESAAINLLHYTSAMGSWTLVGGTITSGHSDPDGGSGAFKYVEQVGNASHVMYVNNPTIDGNNLHTASGFVKADGRNYLRFFLADGATQTFGQFGVIDFVAKTITSSNVSTGTDHASTIEEYPDGWFKFTLSGKMPGAISAFLFCYPDIDGTFNAYIGNGTSGVQFYGLQLETGMASSWIPTSGAASASREADRHQLTLSGYSTDCITVAAEIKMPLDGTNTPIALGIDDGSFANYALLYANSSTEIKCSFFVGGVISVLAVSGLTAGQSYRAAAVLDIVGAVVKLKVTGKTEASAATTITSVVSMSRGDVGNWGGGNYLKSTESVWAVFDRAWTSAEIAEWVDA